jgi:putative radical SAM enzyme (TIGR03279 family)
MPPNLREDLYFMDEDYRLGFMYGNYVTLALARERELDRIVRQQLSPVYLSVHATDMAIRNRLLGLKRSRDLSGTIERLIDGGITLHTQVVLLPEWNDAAILDKTLEDLSSYYPDIASLGIVPVGLTDHRKTLTELKGFESESAAIILDQVESFQSVFEKQHGSRFVYLADEFYLLAGRTFPEQSEYEDFPLIDNGIGMARDFIDTVEREASNWIPPTKPLRVGILTGRLGETLFLKYLKPILDGLEGLNITVHALDNQLFGQRITVSGLLPGRELLEAAKQMPADLDLLLLPPNTVNAADLFLDDLSLEEFRASLPMPLAMPESGLLGPILEIQSA